MFEATTSPLRMVAACGLLRACDELVIPTAMMISPNYVWKLQTKKKERVWRPPLQTTPERGRGNYSLPRGGSREVVQHAESSRVLDGAGQLGGERAAFSVDTVVDQSTSSVVAGITGLAEVSQREGIQIA